MPAEKRLEVIARTFWGRAGHFRGSSLLHEPLATGGPREGPEFPGYIWAQKWELVQTTSLLYG